jgi:hypothetical protein
LAQIAELKNELAQLKAQNGEDWLTEQRAGEIRGIVQDVLADAETRTSLQDSGAMAGWDNGFFLSSPDGNYKLNVSGMVQVRWFMNHADNATDEEQYGFENGNTLLNFAGNIVDPSWTFRVRGNFADNDGAGADGGFALDFAYLEKSMDNGMSIRAGQFKSPFMRETLVEDGYQLAVTRGMLEARFGAGFGQGVQVAYATDNFNVAGWFGNGKDSANETWDDSDTEYALAARAEYKIAGTWDQFANENSFRGEEFGAMIGLAFGAQENSDGAAIEPGNSEWAITGDVTVDFGGATVAGSFVYTDSDASDDNPWGVNVQGGYFVTDDIELFGRYEYITLDREVAAANDADVYNAFTLGANWFFAGNKCKLTADFSMALNGMAIFGATGANNGWRSNAEKDQWALRAQMQLMF